MRRIKWPKLIKKRGKTKVYVDGKRIVSPKMIVGGVKIYVKPETVQGFYYKDCFYSEDPEKFCAEKSEAAKRNFYLEAVKISIGAWRYKVSDNGRENHNITNLPNELTKSLRIKSQKVVSIDLSNSQVTILKGIISSNVVQELFFEVVESGNFYEEVAKIAKCSREEAKICTFELLFGRRRSKIYYLVRKKFPEVFKFVEKYKQEHEKNAFPIFLQREEARIFDEVRATVRAENIPCIGKHDSILVAEEDVARAEQIMRGILEKHLGKVHLKIS